MVWDVLMDIEALGSIIPGSKGLQEIAANTYQSKLAVKVGPVSGKFESTFELAEVKPPASYKLIVAGRGPAGHVSGEGVIRLEQTAGKTVMHYAGDAKIGGKIAAVGQRLLDIAAKQIARQSLNKLARQVESSLVNH